ncbi:FAD-dependent oxidoreductase [Nocardioides sp. HM23]|uniref:FAD-dependent oxidoreductase n=1 Tax=Nocardioides bizhenqiangii TaxID=3095076 RepID=UPI002ACA4AF9|nr:FAD-dependent oxidoreductase [Nocardioides sp. HM23]MDZ5620202.1 FAD-dependent oxidoreductase [Nocardioides sp. HM23]
MTSMTPLWLDRPRATHPTLTAPASYDVVVVGAGIVGILTGLLMARSGRRVAVLEARQVGDGTTGHTTAKVSLLQGTRLSRILRTNGPSVVRDYVTANQEGQAWLRDFCKVHDVAYQERPAYTYATSRPGELRVRAELSVAGLAGLDATWEETTELPYPVRGAVRLADQMQLHPMELMDALVAQLVAEGGELFEGSRLTDLSDRDGKVTLTTEQTNVTAAHVILATGQPVLRRHGFFARLHPQRSYAAALRSPWVPEGMYLSADSPTRSVRSLPVAGGDELLLVGGNGHITGRAASEAARVEDLVGWARSTFGGEVTHTWSAQDQATVSGLPYVGRMLPGNDAVWVATGFDKWGLAAAPAAALMVTKSLFAEDGAGERPPWHRAFSSWTPREVAGVGRAAQFNVGVGVEMVKDVARRQWRDAEHAEPTLRGICTHLGGSVRWNDAERSWDCPLHGSRFDTDGSVLEGPAVCGLRKL